VGGLKLDRAFDPRNNALNAWRLILATGVIFAHAYPFTGHQLPVTYRFGWVDGFFAISGFLITGSWLNKPGRIYFAARTLRILPGLWVCLIITAFIFAPITGTVTLASQIRFVLLHGALLPFPGDIDGTPAGQYHIWNGSLWTLLYEALCYVLVAGLGRAGLLKRRWFISVALAAALAWAVLLIPSERLIGDAAETGQPISPAVFVVLVQIETARLLVMFLIGAWLYLFRDKVPASWTLVAVSAAIFAVSRLLPEYHLIGAIPIAYMLIVSGALIRHRRLQLHTDLSYGVYIYAFPLQQLLLFAGLSMSPLPFTATSIVVTLPVAALSWFLVEKPSLALKTRLKGAQPIERLDLTRPRIGHH